MSTSMDLTAIRRRLSTIQGQQYWRSLEELSDTPEFREVLHREFPQGASVLEFDAVSRRTFLSLMGASLALAGVTGCSRQPIETIVSYAKAPEMFIPGKPVYFATTMPTGGYGLGLLAESHMGRPTKVEGNPEHPASLGSTDIFAQASVLTMYDPDRAAAMSKLGVFSTWDGFAADVYSLLPSLIANGGEGLHILTGTLTSPSLGALLKTVLARFPNAKWRQYDAVSRDAVRNGAVAAFGEPVETVYDFKKASVVVSLDSDFFSHGPGAVRYTRDFTSKRAPEGELANATMNRLFAVQSTPNLVGAMADHRLRVKASQVDTFARALAAGLGVGVATTDVSVLGETAQKFLETVIADLQANKGSGIVIAGENQPAHVHALVHAMNQSLGNVGQTVTYTAPVEVSPVDQLADLTHLVEDLNAGKVNVLLMLGGNPVYDAPVDLKFGEALTKITGLSAHLSMFADETSALCSWHVPESHYLETWGDLRAYDGTVSLIQPLIAPLYATKTAYEVLDILTEKPGRTNHDIVKSYWETATTSSRFEKDWEEWLSNGVVPNTASAAAMPTLKADFSTLPALVDSSGGLEVMFQPDPSAFDGSYANNGWMQECPRPFSKLTWDNAILINPNTAEKLGFLPLWSQREAQVVSLTVGEHSVTGPLWMLPGHPADSVTVHLGYGRTSAGKVGNGVGFNAYSVRATNGLWYAAGGKIAATDQDPHLIARTEDHHLIEELQTAMDAAKRRNIVQVGTFESYKAEPDHFLAHAHFDDKRLDELSMYPPNKAMEESPYQWGMTIDLSRCTGCNACMIACQSENNIAVVGKEQVYRQREMHWIRVDRYYQGDLDNPEVVHQPVPCMQCEKAPCEVVCPVAATVHSEEGLNDMVYNRCVGTRYCSNNCPYKVRRFNFYKFQDMETETFKAMRNPDVTVRSRGVMEKCTYCVQRINHARQDAKRDGDKDGYKIDERSLQTACQQACPAAAITFGNIKNAESDVSKRKAEKRNYELLAELNTRPRTTYLAKLRNPNPELEPKESHSGGEEIHHG
jgi:MoCo/4Fe-4S cofactor protein with predicted Tat translocation signal